MLQFQCPKCQQVLSCDDSLAGTVVGCPKCKQPLKAPAPVQPVEELAPVILEEEAPPKPPKEEKPKRLHARPIGSWRGNPALGRHIPDDLRDEARPLGKPVLMLKTGAPNLLFPIIALALGLVFGLTGLNGLTDRGVRGGVWWLALGATLFGLFMLGCGVVILFTILKDVGRDVILVFQNGLLSLGKDQERVWFEWEDVTGFHQDSLHVKTYVYMAASINSFFDNYTITSPHGTVFISSDTIPGSVREFLREILLTEIPPRVREKAFDALDAGEIVDFGDLRLSNEGLYYGNKSFLPWAEVISIKLEEEKIRITSTSGEWARVNRSGLINLDVFLEMCNQFQSETAPDDANPFDFG